MTEQEEYAKFWAVFIEKVTDIQSEYNNLSEYNKHRVFETVNATFITYGVAGLSQLIQNPPR